VALGSDVGGGTGFGLLKEGLWAYTAQMLRPDGDVLAPAHLLYLATRAGAEALGLAEEIGDFEVGKRADAVLLRPPDGSPLATVLAHTGSPEAALGALFTLGGERDVAAVYLDGHSVLPG
jgi:guanine deaminase